MKLKQLLIVLGDDFNAVNEIYIESNSIQEYLYNVPFSLLHEFHEYEVVQYEVSSAEDYWSTGSLFLKFILQGS